MESTSESPAAIGQIAALDGEFPRRAYWFVRRARRPVSRDEVAADLGVSRRLAAFHLERLLKRGLLNASYARPPGRSGPGAGRSAKFYEPSDVRIDLSLPQTRYDLAGSLLVEAMTTQEPGESAADAARRVADEKGREFGRQVRRQRAVRPPGPERALSVAAEALEDLGFEPYQGEDGSVALHNCPFHALAQEAPELVCDMNRSFVEGFLRALGNDSVESILTRNPGDCCVTLRAPKATRGRAHS